MSLTFIVACQIIKKTWKWIPLGEIERNCEGNVSFCPFPQLEREGGGREMSCIRERDPSAEVRKRSALDGNFCPKKVKLQYHWAIGSMRETVTGSTFFQCAICHDWRHR